jgi:hypothetical protein
MTPALATTPASVPVPVYQQRALNVKRQRAKPTILTADESPVRKAKANRLPKPATPTALEQEAARLGFPASLFGFTPQQKEYWQEPSLPWWTEQLRANPPVGYNGEPKVPFTAYIQGNRMGPRFPNGCAVMLAPTFERKHLVIGKVYTYSYRDAESGEMEMCIGRLVKIGGNHLEVTSDISSLGDPDRAIWLLRDDEAQAVWDVREVTHYVSYPDLDTLPSAG